MNHRIVMKNISFFRFTVVLLVGCASIISCKKSSNTKPLTTVKDTIVNPISGTKLPIVGLVTQGSAKGYDSTWVPDNTFPEVNAHPLIYVAVVIRVEWKQLEPQRGQFDYSVIDQAFTHITNYNLGHPTKPVTGKLRIFSGANAPAWVKALSGGMVSVIEDNSGSIVKIPRFWTAEYRQAWLVLQTALAARYDSNPLLQEVAVSSCGSTDAEPFIQPFNAISLTALHAAGFTDNAFKTALSGALDDYAPWKKTAIDYTFNPFRATDSGKPVVDSTYAPMLMQAFRTRYGSRGVIANHGLQNLVTAAQSSIYARFLTLGKPIEFQTLAPNVDWNATITLGLAYHPTEIEIWDTKDAGGPANVSLSQLQTWAPLVGK